MLGCCLWKPTNNHRDQNTKNTVDHLSLVSFPSTDASHFFAEMPGNIPTNSTCTEGTFRPLCSADCSGALLARSQIQKCCVRFNGHRSNRQQRDVPLFIPHQDVRNSCCALFSAKKKTTVCRTASRTAGPKVHMNLLPTSKREQLVRRGKHNTFWSKRPSRRVDPCATTEEKYTPPSKRALARAAGAGKRRHCKCQKKNDTSTSHDACKPNSRFKANSTPSKQ